MDTIYDAIVKSRRMFGGKDKDKIREQRMKYCERVADEWRGSNPETNVRARLPVLY